MTEQLPDPVPQPMDADAVAASELRGRLLGGGEPVLFSSDIAPRLREWDPGTPATYWALLDGETVAFLQGLQADAGADVVLSGFRDPVPGLRSQRAALPMEKLMAEGFRLARSAGAPWTMAVVPAQGLDGRELRALVLGTAALPGVHGILLERPDTVEGALIALRALMAEAPDLAVAVVFSGQHPTDLGLSALHDGGCCAVGAEGAEGAWAASARDQGLGLIHVASPAPTAEAILEGFRDLGAHGLMPPPGLGGPAMAELAAGLGENAGGVSETDIPDEGAGCRFGV